MAENARESLQILLDVCLLLSSKIDLYDVLRTITELSSRVVKSERGSLFLLDPATNELYFHVALGLDEETSKIRLKPGQGIAGTVAKTGLSEVINDVHADPRWHPFVDLKSGFVTRSILAVPMTMKGQLIGVVEAINHIDGPFSEEDLRIFEAFASQAAIAIENARLFASLSEEQTKLKTVFTQMSDAAVLTDEKGLVLLSNESARRFFTAGSGPGRTIVEEMAGMTSDPPLRAVLASGEPVASFEAVRESPKKLILAGTATFLRFEGTGGGAGWSGRLFVFRDVTEARQEDLLKRSFLSLISHKLKTPLASITGYAQIMLDEGPGKAPPEAAGRMLQTIMSQGRKLSELVDRLLRFTTLQELDNSDILRKPFPIEEAVQQAVESMGPWLVAHNATVNFEPRGQRALGDPNLIRDAVKNLIENGVKFNPKPAKRVDIRAEDKDGFVVLHVADDGPGIPPEDQERIFSKFYQVEASFTGQVEGWGLGLAFVRKVVEQHGGKVELHSKLEHGTTVSLSLPMPPAGSNGG